MYCPAFILDLILLFSFAVQYHVTWCLSDTSLRWCNGTQVSRLLQREGTMRSERTHTHTHTHDMSCCGPDEGWLSVLTLMATAKHRHHTATTHSISLCTDHMNLEVKTHLRCYGDSCCVRRRQTNKGETECKGEAQEHKYRDWDRGI